MMKDSTVYASGNPKSIIAWYNNGYMADSSIFDKDGSGIQTAWFDNGAPSHSGRFFRQKKEGKWQYFHKNGKPAATEEYKQDKLLSRVYYDEAGVQLTDTASKDGPAEFKGGSKKWRSFLIENLVFPPGVKITNTEKITVVISATIDEEGKVTDAFVSVPVHAAFDNEALRVLKKSPKWIPATDHNRHIKYYIRQPITFGQYD